MYSHQTEIKLVTPMGIFGNGDHESTQVVLDALYNAIPSGKDVLDVGTGNGIQAIFAKKWGAAHVVAVDIDANAIYAARANFERNNVEIEARLGIYNEFLDFQANIIIANLPPHNVRDFLKIAQKNLKAGGKLICSWAKFANIYNECDLTNYNIVDHIEGLEWDAYILEGKG